MTAYRQTYVAIREGHFRTFKVEYTDAMGRGIVKFFRDQKEADSFVDGFPSTTVYRLSKIDQITLRKSRR